MKNIRQEGEAEDRELDELARQDCQVGRLSCVFALFFKGFWFTCWFGFGLILGARAL